MAKTIDQLIDEEHETGNTEFTGTAIDMVALRTNREGEMWHYYKFYSPAGRYVLTGTTENLEAD